MFPPMDCARQGSGNAPDPRRHCAEARAIAAIMEEEGEANRRPLPPLGPPELAGALCHLDARDMGVRGVTIVNPRDNLAKWRIDAKRGDKRGG